MLEYWLYEFIFNFCIGILITAYGLNGIKEFFNKPDQITGIDKWRNVKYGCGSGFVLFVGILTILQLMNFFESALNLVDSIISLLK